LEDIMSIAALLEPYPQFLVCPLHSTTPEEEQDLAFEPTPPGNVKVVLATNMAESSVTIPDCDVVICLGTHKSISYSESLQSTHVAFGRISKASATQRAGRTGRVRPGTVYRLYTKETYDEMREHDLSEVLCRPLEDVVLNMWTVLEDAHDFQGVTPFLNRLIETPDARYIDKSYVKLHNAALITLPSDDGCLTPTGRFVSSLPLNLSIGRMVYYGVLLGVPAEAIVMAASSSLSRPHPYRMANTTFLDPDQYNTQIRNRFLSEVHYDEGDYSEPIARIRLLLDWRALESDKERYRFCHYNNLQFSVMEQFDRTAVSLTDHLWRFEQAQCPTAKRVDISSISTLSTRTVNLLRLIMVWSCWENILTLESSQAKVEEISASEGVVDIESDKVTAEHMKTLFGPIPYSMHVSETSEVYSFSRAVDCTEPDSYLRLAQLVKRLANVATFYATKCFGIIMETIESDRSLVVFVLLHGDNLHSLSREFTSCMSSKLRPSGEALAERLTGDCSFIGDAVILTYDDATELEVRNVYEMLNRIPDTIIVTVTVDEIARLDTVSTPLCPSHVALLFGVVVANKKEKKEFVMEAPPRKITTLSFPKESEDSLIEDLPIGHRFVQCCRANRKRCRLVIALKESEVTQEDMDQAEITWLEEPYKARRANTCPRREVSVWSVQPIWHYLRGKSCFVAKMPRQGMMSASFHCGPEPLFAVALTALPLTSQNVTTFATGGVSFLPTDSAWLRLALHVVDKDHIWDNQWEEEVVENDDELEDLRPFMDVASDIGVFLKEVSNFERRGDIIAKIHSLFAEFTKDPAQGGAKQVHTKVQQPVTSLEFVNEVGSHEKKQINESTLLLGKVVDLPPSGPKPVVAPRLTSTDKKVNQNHGYDQANAYKLAHEARKRAAADDARTGSHVTLSEPIITHSTTHHIVENNDSVRTSVRSPCAPVGQCDSSCDEEDWETNADKFSAELKRTWRPVNK